MSRKISDFFKATPLGQNKVENRKNAEIKNEAEENFEINFGEIQGKKSKIQATLEIKTHQDRSKIIKIEPECGSQENNLETTISIPAIKKEITENFNKIIKTDTKKEFPIKLPSKLKLSTKKSQQKKVKMPFQCKICSSKFIVSHRLDLHIRMKHLCGQTDQFECDFDGKIFNKRISLKSHMESHLPNIKCKICGLEMKVKSMKDHMTSLHSDERKHKCKICSKSFKLHSVLNNHLGSHDKKFECKICSKKFRNEPDLKNHTKEVHENPRSFKCEICEKGFYDKGNFKKHQKTHDKNRQKAYKCDRCSYSSDNKAHYKLHENYHERWDAKVGKNPVKCTKCPIMLKDKKHLSYHMLYVHPVNLFQCDLCAMFSKTKPNFEKHMKIVHLKK